MSLILSAGRWGGFYIRLGYFNRVCLGFVALTFIFVDFDILIDELIQEGDHGMEKRTEG